MWYSGDVESDVQELSKGTREACLKEAKYH